MKSGIFDARYFSTENENLAHSRRGFPFSAHFDVCKFLRLFTFVSGNGKNHFSVGLKKAKAMKMTFDFPFMQAEETRLKIKNHLAHY